MPGRPAEKITGHTRRIQIEIIRAAPPPSDRIINFDAIAIVYAGVYLPNLTRNSNKLTNYGPPLNRAVYLSSHIADTYY